MIQYIIPSMMAAFNFLKAAQCSNKNNAKEDGRIVEHVRDSEQRPTKRELSYAKRNSSVNGNFGFSSLPLNFSQFFSLFCLFILASFFVRLCAVVCTLRGSKCISAEAKTFIGFFSDLQRFCIWTNDMPEAIWCFQFSFVYARAHVSIHFSCFVMIWWIVLPLPLPLP